MGNITSNIADIVCETHTFFDPSFSHLLYYKFYMDVCATNPVQPDEKNVGDKLLQRINALIQKHNSMPGAHLVDTVTLRDLQMLKQHTVQLSQCIQSVALKENRKRVRGDTLLPSKKRHKKAKICKEMKLLVEKLKAASLTVKVAKTVRGDYDVFIDSRWVDEYENSGVFLMKINVNATTFKVVSLCKESGLQTSLFAGAPSTIVVYSGIPLLQGAKYHEKFNDFQNALLRTGIVMVNDSNLQHHVFFNKKNVERFCTGRGTSLLSLHAETVTDDVKKKIKGIIEASGLYYKNHGDNYVAISRKQFKTPEKAKLDNLSIHPVQIERDKLKTLDKHTSEDQLFRVAGMYTGIRYYVIHGWKRMNEATREFILMDENIDCFFNNFDKDGNTRLCSCGKYIDSDEEDPSDDEQYYMDEEVQDCHCDKSNSHYTLLPILQIFSSERECTVSIQKQNLHPMKVAIYMKQIGSKVDYVLIKNWDDLTAAMKTTVHENLLCFIENKDLCRGNSCKHRDILQHSSLTYRLVVNNGKIVGDLRPIQCIKSSELNAKKEVEEVLHALLRKVEARNSKEN